MSFLASTTSPQAVTIAYAFRNMKPEELYAKLLSAVEPKESTTAMASPLHAGQGTSNAGGGGSGDEVLHPTAIEYLFSSLKCLGIVNTVSEAAVEDPTPRHCVRCHSTYHEKDNGLQMCKKTAWTSSVPSDRIPPSRPSQPAAQSKTGGKGKGKGPAEPPKSPAIQKLVKAIKDLREASLVDPDPKGGCFCQSRTHPLSTYTPLCLACGLVLCSINQPHFACPHCLSPLVPSNTRRSELLEVIEGELAEQERKEEAERIRQEEEKKAAAGAFPTLAQSSSTGAPTLVQPAPTTHKVLSIGGAKGGGKKGKVTLSSYSQSPTPSQQSSRSSTPRPREPEIVRALQEPGAAGAGGFYVPPPASDNPGPGDSKKEGGGKRRKKGKGGGEKGKEKENEDVVPDAGDASGT
ncbi:hypothetical protein EST38_g10335 [Candolleomyces aberdarensis]|uniref:TRIP4/RQT4 C2HC5-type zinc finger domain-containing protein n=1 Tax=Candolleomyces aberdarensis TaxID=2316362 RepID=A0A4Q2D7M9_9AGAR|nr:hypothetical protein EST38_g10335 [Candolleomyces aberdarensis]